MSPREKVLQNSKGQTDFRIKTIKTCPFGRKEIEMAEQGIYITCTCTLPLVRARCAYVLRRTTPPVARFKPGGAPGCYNANNARGNTVKVQ